MNQFSIEFVNLVVSELNRWSVRVVRSLLSSKCGRTRYRIVLNLTIGIDTGTALYFAVLYYLIYINNINDYK